MTARSRTARRLTTTLAVTLAIALLTLVLPGLAPGAQAAVRPAPTKARLVTVLKKVAFPKGTTLGKVETDSIPSTEARFCGYTLPAKFSVSRASADEKLSVGYLPTASTSKARTFVQKVHGKGSCENGMLRRTTLKGAPRGTAALVLVIPIDDTHDIRLYLAFAATGRTVVLATAASKKDTATLLSNAVRSYQKAKLA